MFHCILVEPNTNGIKWNQMERIIYLDTDLGYKCADVKNQQDLIKKQLDIAKHGYYTVCVLDLDSDAITQKCDSFSSHAGFIKKCYPKYLPELVLQPISNGVHF
jgi:hypothetical protein